MRGSRSTEKPNAGSSMAISVGSMPSRHRLSRSRELLRAGLVMMVSAAAVVLPMYPAAGVSECVYSDGTVTVTIGSSDPVPLSASLDGAILVSGAACDLATVDNTSQVVIQGGEGAQTVVLDEREAPLASSLDARVKVVLALGEGQDVLDLYRSDAADRIAVGSSGLTLTQSPVGRDINLSEIIETIRIWAGGGSDVVSAAGSSITGAAYGGNVLLRGEDGDDQIAGGASGDDVAGGTGADVIAGGAGPDSLLGRAGPDKLLGENGNDDLGGGTGIDRCFQYAGTGAMSSCELPVNRSPLPTSPYGQIVVVNQNTKESHPYSQDHIFTDLGDMESSKELTNFARRLPRWVPYAPDVLVHQEIKGRGAKFIAAALERVFNQPYSAVVRPPRGSVLREVETSRGRTLHKTNTAVIINERTMRFVRGGFFKTAQRERDRTGGLKATQYQAHALVEERGTKMRAAVVSIHFNSNKNFSSAENGFTRRTEWSEQVASLMEENYPAADIRVMAGEFCTRRCVDYRRERVTCLESQLWTTLTSGFGYQDAVYVANNSSYRDIAEQATSNHGKPKRIDFVFAQGQVLSASRDVTYQAYKGDRHFISDHKADYAVVGTS